MLNFRSLRKFYTQSLSYSYIHGTSPNPLQYMTVSAKFDQISQKYGDNIALISHHQNKEYKYGELWDEANHIAASLIALGLKPKDRIGIYAPNNAEWYLLQLASSLADLILVNINPAYQSSELKFVLNKVECKALVTAISLKKSNYIDILYELAPELHTSQPGHLNSKELPYLKSVIRLDDEKSNGFYNFEDLYSFYEHDHERELEKRKAKQEPDHPANIQFTSGTTGSPKAAVLTHMNILNNSYFLGERLKYNDKDVICLPVPLYHCFGMVMGNLAALNRGATIVYPSESFNAKEALIAASKYKCTSIYGVPTMFIDYLNEFNKEKSSLDLSNLHKGIVAGALCPKKLMERLISEMGLTGLTNCYGMTETSPVSFQSSEKDSFEKKVNSVGTILPHLECKIVDEEGFIVPKHSKGELCVRGYSVMQGYWEDSHSTKKTIDSKGWIHSGDLAQMDDEGYVTIVGRSKDMIIRGGENIYPKEIEEFLLHMENVEDVQVFGVSDEKFGEEVCAFIRLKNKQKTFYKAEVLDFCKGKISHFKIPKYVRVVDHFPLTVTGKPQKFRMHEETEHLFKDPKKKEELRIR